jgi:hypothetical protein
MSFFFLFILYYYLAFLDGSKKKTLHVIFAFNSNSPQIEHIYKKYKHKKKSVRGPQINQRRPQIFLEFSVIKKGFIWSNIKLEWT